MHKHTDMTIATESNDEIMTLADVANYLHIERKMVKGLMENYGLPYNEISSRPIYRFHKSSVVKWFHDRETQNPMC